MEEFQLVDLSRRFLTLDSFWTLPRQFLGNKVKAQIPSQTSFTYEKLRVSNEPSQVEEMTVAEQLPDVGEQHTLVDKAPSGFCQRHLYRQLC